MTWRELGSAQTGPANATSKIISNPVDNPPCLYLFINLPDRIFILSTFSPDPGYTREVGNGLVGVQNPAHQEGRFAVR